MRWDKFSSNQELQENRLVEKAKTKELVWGRVVKLTLDKKTICGIDGRDIPVIGY
jgi:hypothetical protein